MVYRWYFLVPAEGAWDQWLDVVRESKWERQVDAVRKQAEEDVINATLMAESLESTAGTDRINYQRGEEKARAELRVAKQELGDAGEVMAAMEADMRDMMTLHEETEAVHLEEQADAKARYDALEASDRGTRAAGKLMAVVKVLFRRARYIKCILNAILTCHCKIKRWS